MYRQIITDVFFDLDHTLWDFDKNSALTFKKILYEQSVSVDLEEFLTIYAPINLSYWKLYREEKIGKSELRYQRLKTTFDRLKYPIRDEQIDILSRDYIAHLSNFNHLLPSAIDILEYLKPRYKLHIITNGFQEIQEKKLRNAGILEYFGHVVNSEMAGVKKPNPSIFQMALNRAGASPESALMVGDSLEADILGAQAVGLHTLHFNAHNDPVHDYCQMIHDLSEIKMYL
ncbi:MAG: YjjG family noncanonical pyrimidine nucleotidase [Gramella sp.]|nr:YjjG family noncanonical pyrimidine nucleotidase [Christiangramia sp.]